MVVAEFEEVFESFCELGFELGEYFGFGPVESLKVLNPLEITHSDSTCVAENVGDKKDIPTLLNDIDG